jgi:hypothetical protein
MKQWLIIIMILFNVCCAYSQNIKQEFVEVCDSTSGVVTNAIIKTNNGILYFGKTDSENLDSTFAFCLKLNRKDGKFQKEKFKVIKDKYNFSGGLSEVSIDEDGKINIIGMIYISGINYMRVFYDLRPRKLTLDEDFNVVKVSMDSLSEKNFKNNDNVIIQRLNKDTLLVPYYGMIDNDGEKGLYFKYYDNDCKSLGYKYISKLEPADFNGVIDSIKTVLGFIPTIYHCSDGFLAFGTLTYWSKDLEYQLSASVIIKYGLDNKIQWIKKNTDSSFGEDNYIYGLTRLGEKYILKGGADKQSKKPGNAKVFTVDINTLSIIDSVSFGTLPRITILNVFQLRDSSYICAGYFNRTFPYGETQPKYYAAKLDKNLKFQWEIVSYNEDATTILLEGCVELENNELFLTGHKDFEFMGLLIDNPSSDVLEIKPNGESSIKINTENHKIKLTNKGESSNIQCVLTDMLGGVVLKKNIELLGGAEYEIEESSISAGAYILQVEANGIMISKKIII